MRLASIAVLALGLTAGCSSEPAATGTGGSGAAGTGAAGTGAGGGTGGGSGGQAGGPVIGGDRPVEVIVPEGYQPGKPAPLLIVLHGFTVSGLIEELYLHLAPMAE